MTGELLKARRASAFRGAKEVQYRLETLVVDVRQIIDRNERGETEHRIAEEIQKVILWGVANLCLDQLSRDCRELAVTMARH